MLLDRATVTGISLDDIGHEAVTGGTAGKRHRGMKIQYPISKILCRTCNHEGCLESVSIMCD